MGRILYALSPSTFPSQIKNSVSASAGTALLAIQRALGSGSMVRGGQTRTGGTDEARIIWTGLERAFKEVQKEGKGISVMEKGLLPNVDAEGDDEGEGDTIGSLLDLAKEGNEGLDGVTPVAWFWREIASGLDKRLRDACRCMIRYHFEYSDFTASPFLARSLRMGYSRLQNLVRETVVGSREDATEGYNGPEVVLMLQSIASIQPTR
jgi:hypothetical protein